MLEIGAVVWGVQDIPRAVAFWSSALNYKLKYPASDDWAVLVPADGNGVQHHVELFTDQKEAEVERLLALGATRKEWRYPDGADYVVLQDPDGNPFCVVQR